MTIGEVGCSHTSPVFIIFLTSTDVLIKQLTLHPILDCDRSCLDLNSGADPGVPY